MIKKVIAVSLLSLSSMAFAETGGYVGIGVGQTSVDVDATGLTSVDDTDTGFKIYGGYTFNKNFALEAGYADLGKMTAEDSTIQVRAQGEASALFVDAVATLPVTNEFSVFGRAGIAFTRLEVSAFAPGASASAEENETNFKFGLGAQYAFTKNVALRAEWERYMDIGNNATTGEFDVDMLSIGLNYKF